MDCDEYALWQAWSRYHMPLDSSWEQAAMLAYMFLAPHTPRGYQINPRDFIPVLKTPQTQSHIDRTLEAIHKDLQNP